MKKEVGLLIVSMLIIISVLGFVTPAKEIDFESKSPEKCFEYVNNDEYDWVLTYGPISPLIDCFEIEFIDGDPQTIQRIQYLLNTKFLFDKLGIKSFGCENLSFTINYYWDYQNNRPRENFPFFTTLIDKERFFRTYFNNLYYYKNHTVTVKVFNGFFMTIRNCISIFKLPGYFEFWGEFEEVTIIEQ